MAKRNTNAFLYNFVGLFLDWYPHGDKITGHGNMYYFLLVMANGKLPIGSYLHVRDSHPVEFSQYKKQLINSFRANKHTGMEGSSITNLCW